MLLVEGDGSMNAVFDIRTSGTASNHARRGPLNEVNSERAARTCGPLSMKEATTLASSGRAQRFPIWLA